MLRHRAGISRTILLAVVGALRGYPPLAVPVLRRGVHPHIASRYDRQIAQLIPARRLRHRGISIVEMMIALGIASFLLMAGIPSFITWMQNAQNRTAAESILNGLTLARVEAVKRNAPVRFALTDGTGLVAWNVGCVNVTADCPATIQRRVAEDGLPNARVGVDTTVISPSIPAGHFSTPIAAGTGLAAGVSFNGLGRVPEENLGVDISRVDVTNASSAGARRFVVMIGAGGMIRMCDPALDFLSNPQGCS